jgi:hypothetical protein
MKMIKTPLPSAQLPSKDHRNLNGKPVTLYLRNYRRKALLAMMICDFVLEYLCQEPWLEELSARKEIM